ncbi:hypothetical protein H4R20_001359 [Coemansia guatemalensis]|uniref:Ribosomal protein L10 n=1 Tax=Coemansia guatemalensis TaxID=2761395 RepID=A0A9W8HZR1_9FUNG|nr:hypothetical protein H4R20_001359 [Coemansia guatemalensis]
MLARLSGMLQRTLLQSRGTIARRALCSSSIHYQEQASQQGLAQKLERSAAPKTLTTYKKPFSPRKQYLFREYDRYFAQSPAVIIVQHYNLSGAEQTEQRIKLKAEAQGARLMIARSKMVQAVLRDTRYENMAQLFSGPSAFIFWDQDVADPLVAMRQAMDAIQRQRKIVVVGAVFGDVLLNTAMLKDFVNLPNIDQLRAQLLGAIQYPAQKLTAILQRVPQRLVGVLEQKAQGESGKPDSE